MDEIDATCDKADLIEWLLISTQFQYMPTCKNQVELRMSPTCRNVKTNLEAPETLRLKNLKMTSACQCHGSSAAPTCKVDASLMSFSPSC